MKQVIVGVYNFGTGNVQLVLREGDGGEFYFAPDKISPPRIKVGADQPNWNLVVATLLHEILEMQMTLQGFRFSPAPDFANDNSSYLFVMNHPQFSEVCARSAMFVASALPDLSKAWSRWKK